MQYRLDLISSPKDYVEILDGIMPIEKGIGLFDGIIGITWLKVGGRLDKGRVIIAGE